MENRLNLVAEVHRDSRLRLRKRIASILALFLFLGGAVVVGVQYIPSFNEDQSVNAPLVEKPRESVSDSISGRQSTVIPNKAREESPLNSGSAKSEQDLYSSNSIPGSSTPNQQGQNSEFANVVQVSQRSSNDSFIESREAATEESGNSISKMELKGITLKFHTPESGEITFVDEPEYFLKPEREIFNPEASRLSLGFVAGPDFSFTGGGEGMDSGFKFGGLIGFRISRSISLSTGALRSNTNYISNGSEYSVPPGFWDRETRGEVPESIEAACVVLDIPLNIEFTFKQRQRDRWFIGTGFSSYIMLNEKYDYGVSYGNDTWEVSNQNNHFFGVANLSVGYQCQIGQHTSFRVEPFIKAPLTGIGWGEVSLYSTGVFFSLNYHFLKRK